MPRRCRICPPGLPVHLVQRGNNRQVCFAADADMKAYAHWLHAGAVRFGVDIRDALNTGLVLGNDRFKQEAEKLTSQRQHHVKRESEPR